MERCTLSRTFVCWLVVLLAAAAAAPGCGGDDGGPADRTERFQRTPLNRPGESGRETRRACALMRPRELARLVGRPGLPLQATPNDSTDPTICNWHGSGLGVKLVVDEPERRPHQLDHVGDDSAYGGAGAWWTRSKSQLVAYADKRILRIRVTGRDLDDPARQGAAVRTARLTFERLSEPGP